MAVRSPGAGWSAGLRRVAAALLRRPREARRRDAVPAQRDARAGRPGRAAGRGRRALPALRRRVADQRAVPRPARRARRGLRGARRRPADLLGQPELAPDARGHRGARCATTGSRTRSAFATSAYGGYSSCRQYREDIARARATGRPGRPGDRQAAALPRPPGLRRAARRRASGRAGRRSTRPARRPPGWSSPPTPSRSRWPTRPARDGGRYTAQLTRDGRAGRRRGRRRPAVGPGLAEPLRPAAGAVAGAGRQRPPGGARRGRA